MCHVERDCAFENFDRGRCHGEERVEVSKNQTMEEAAKLFAAHGMSSAPVVDEQGHCVGMLSSSDFLRRDCPQDENGKSGVALQGHSLVEDEPGEALRIVSANDAVSCYMGAGVQSITADVSLLDAGRMMCVARVNHLPVLERDRVVGIVSTMDLVAAMLNAFDEMDAN